MLTHTETQRHGTKTPTDTHGMHVHTCSHIDTHTDSGTDTQTDRQACTYACMHAQTQTQTHRHTDTDTHTHPHTHTHYLNSKVAMPTPNLNHCHILKQAHQITDNHLPACRPYSTESMYA